MPTIPPPRTLLLVAAASLAVLAGSARAGDQRELVISPFPLPGGSWDSTWPDEGGYLDFPPLHWLPPAPSRPDEPAKPPIPAHVRPAVTPATSSAVAGLNGFGFDLFRNLREAGGEPNALVSPLSITTAFGMAYAGARGNTAAEMESVFGFNPGAHAGLGALISDLNTVRDGRELRVVNRLFASEGLRLTDDFLAITGDQYGAPVERMDFASQPEPSRARINDWVEEQTNDRIQDLLPGGSVTPGTSLVLVNALYLNSEWKHGFKSSLTYDQPFYRADGSTKLTPTMHQQERFRYGDFDGYKMLEMPYAGDDLSMVIALPDTIDGLAALESSYTAEQFAADLNLLSYHEVVVSLPKFTFDTTEKLNEPLFELGVRDAFVGADFSGMADGGSQIDGVYHKTFIDVSESGTEAAAATAIVLESTDRAWSPPPVEFNANRSFLFAIRDTHTGAVLFVGRMGDPVSDGAAIAPQAELTVPEPTAAALAGLLLLAAARVARG